MLDYFALEQKLYALEDRFQEEAAMLHLLKSLPVRQSPLDRMTQTLNHWLNAQTIQRHMQWRPRIALGRSAAQALVNRE
jgi:hypothetical protein